MLKRLIYIGVCSTSFLCSCAKQSKRYYIENQLSEDVRMQGFIEDSRNLAGEVGIVPNERLLIFQFTTRDPRSNNTAIDALNIFFNGRIDSIVFIFEDSKTLSLTSTNNGQLNIFDEFNWENAIIDKNDREAVFNITQAHKDAAN